MGYHDICYWNGISSETILQVHVDADKTPYFSFNSGGGEGFVPALDNDERVGFVATPSDRASNGVYLFEHGNTSQVAVGSGSWDPYYFFDRPYLNNSRGIIFNAALSSSAWGLFTGPDPNEDRIVRTGNLLLGSTVAKPRVYRGGFNDHGRVVFTSSFTDGTPYGIYLATPVPEPSTLVLLSTAALGLLAYAYRRRRCQAIGDHR